MGRAGRGVWLHRVPNGMVTPGPHAGPARADLPSFPRPRRDKASGRVPVGDTFGIGRYLWALLWVMSFVGQCSARAPELTVTARVQLLDPAARGKPTDNSNAVVWLTPVAGSAGQQPQVPDASPHRFRLVQKNKRFTPHILVVPVGSAVEFPNLDPFFHNVFSLFDGKRFDLGLYEAGTTRTVNFNAAGVSYIFCNIHPEMSAVVLVLKTPYYGISNGAGEVSIQGVPPGRYELNVWHERCLPDTLKAAAREVVVSSSAPSLGAIRLHESGDLLKNHKNKYGREYETPSNPPYELP